jgi:hypothetical protein
VSIPTTAPGTTFAQLVSGGLHRVIADVVAANGLPESTAVITRGIVTTGTRSATNLILTFTQGDPIPSNSDPIAAIDEALNALAAASLTLTATRALLVANPGVLTLIPNTAGVPFKTKRLFP